MTAFKKPSNMHFVDMCAYIDNHIYDKNPDYTIIYKYLYIISHMLACNKRYFDNDYEYDEFASLLAYSVFQRLTDNTKSHVKSVLNYINSIIYFRKASYDSKKHPEVIDPSYVEEWDSLAYTEKVKSIIETKNRYAIENNVTDLINSIPSSIDKFIPKVYKTDKMLWLNLRKSCILSLLSTFTIPEKHKNRQLFTTGLYQEDVKFYSSYIEKEIILWHLPDEMKNVVAIVLNKVNNYIIEEIECLIGENRVSDTDLNNMMSVFSSGGNSYETNY